MIQSTQVTTGATAVPIFSISGSLGPVSVFIRNDDGANAVWIGGPGVTAGTGFKLTFGATLGPLLLGTGDDLYALAAAGTPVVQVLWRQ